MAMIRAAIYWAHVMSRLWAKPLAPQILIGVPKSSIVYPGFRVTELGLREVKPYTQGHTARWELYRYGASMYRFQDVVLWVLFSLEGPEVRGALRLSLVGGSCLD